MFDQNEIIEFIDIRLGETRRLAMLLAQTPELPVQAAADQLERLTEVSNELISFLQYQQNNPITPVILKRIANAWIYHDDFKPEWIT